jgi:hypothetical protein
MSSINDIKFIWLSKSQEPTNLSKFKEISWLVTWILACLIIILIILLSYNFSLERDDVLVRDRFDRTEVPVSLYSEESLVQLLRESFQIDMMFLQVSGFEDYFQKFRVTLMGSDCRKGTCESGDYHFAGMVEHEEKTLIVFSHTAGVVNDSPDQTDRIMARAELVCEMYTDSTRCDPPCEACSDNADFDSSWNLTKVIEIGRPGQIVFRSVERSKLNVISFALSSFITGTGVISLIVKTLLLKNKNKNKNIEEDVGDESVQLNDV